MKRMIAMLLVLLLVFAAGCAAQQKAAPEESTVPADTPEESAQVGLANPWTEYDNLADAEAAAGFAFPQPKWDVSYDTVTYRVTDGIIEIIYTQDDGQCLTLRKGADETDISGDYNEYNYTVTNGDFLIKGEANEQGDVLCRTVTWVADGHFYSIYCALSETMQSISGTAQLVADAQG